MSLVSGVETAFRGSRELCAIMEERLGVDNFNMTGPQAQALFSLVLVPYFKKVTDVMDDAVPVGTCTAHTLSYCAGRYLHC